MNEAEYLLLRETKVKKIKSDFAFYFDFLSKDFGMEMVNEIAFTDDSNMFIQVLKNKYVQIELAGDENSFCAIIRKIINGDPKPYSDKRNNIYFEDLAILSTNHNYDHFDYYATPISWLKVLGNSAKLMKNCAEVFTTSKWVDIEKIEILKDRDFNKKFGYSPSKEPSFFDILKKEAKKILIDKEYKLVFDSSELPPYNSESLFKKVVFEKNEVTIEISQQDWRDNYNQYFIKKNRETVYDIDLAKFNGDIIQASNIMTDKLQEITN